MSSLLLGLVLTFGTVDGTELQLTVSLTEAATASLSWGELTRTASTPGTLLRFSGLPAPSTAPVRYRLELAGAPPIEAEVSPISTTTLAIAVYGDSRDGPGPHRGLLDALADSAPSVVVHTGDLAATALDREGWEEHLRATRPLGHVPSILALGNHDLYVPPELRGKFDAMAQAVAHWPPPDDPLAREHRVPPSVFRVRVGPALFVALDSNAPIGPDAPQRRFLEAALADKGDARFTFVAMHHGPVSAGPHGRHKGAVGLADVLAKHRVTAVLAGHDHTYQRIVQDGVTYLVSGGGGAPLYWRSRLVPGVRAFSPTYHWLRLELSGDRAVVEARGLSGAVLDRAVLGEDGEETDRPVLHAAVVIGALLLVLGTMVAGAWRMIRIRQDPS